jgi:prepilin-type N-terminal cleavage/methylation domain-containing protein
MYDFLSVKNNLQKRYRRHLGFSLLETVVVISILSLIAGVSIRVFTAYNDRNNLVSAINTTTEALYLAQLKSEAVENDSSWGVKFDSNLLTIFQGDSFSGRNQVSDIEVGLPQAISLSGLSEIVFSKRDGRTLGGNLFLTNGRGATSTISINSLGTLNY